MKKYRIALLIMIFIIVCTMLCACSPSPYDIVADSLRSSGKETRFGTDDKKFSWTSDDDTCEVYVYNDLSVINIEINLEQTKLDLWLYPGGTVRWHMFNYTTGNYYHMWGEIEAEYVTSSSIDLAFSEDVGSRSDNIPTNYVLPLKNVAKTYCQLAIAEFNIYLLTCTDLTLADFGFVNY